MLRRTIFTRHQGKSGGGRINNRSNSILPWPQTQRRWSPPSFKHPKHQKHRSKPLYCTRSLPLARKKTSITTRTAPTRIMKAQEARLLATSAPISTTQSTLSLPPHHLHRLLHQEATTNPSTLAIRRPHYPHRPLLQVILLTLPSIAHVLTSSSLQRR